MTVVEPSAIEDARALLAGVLRPTPVEYSEHFSALCGRPVFFKPEYRQLTGSYKIRGAYNMITRLPAGVEVVAASAGNHAQGVARAAKLTGRRATIFMPVTAALPKVESTRADGADVRLVGAVVDESLAAARVYAQQSGATLVHPFDDASVIAGQGTIGLELAEEMPADVEAVIVPVGGGGLISGVGAALAYARPGVRLVGVEAAGAPAMRAALDAGHPVLLDRIGTIADGIAVKSVSDLTLEHARAFATDVVTVTDDEISQTLLLLLERTKAVVEPAGAAAIAGVVAHRVPGTGPVVAVLSGGNVDPLLLTRLIEHGLTAAGRYLLLRIVLDDRPGALAAVTSAVARLGLNVMEVEHHRVGLKLGVEKVEVLFTVETRDPEHRDQVVRALEADGFTVELQV